MTGNRTILLSILLLCCASLSGQSGAGVDLPVLQARRVNFQGDASARRTLGGHVPPWARREMLSPKAVDPEGKVAVTFTLTRAPQAQAAFEQLLKDQQDPASPRYHHWLTPEQIGKNFGPLTADIEAFTSWLTGQGFQVSYVAPSGVFVHASARTASVTHALGFEFGNYVVGGEVHRAPASEPSLPATLSPLVASVQGLEDLPERSFAHFSSPESAGAAGRAEGLGARFTNSAGTHAIEAGDFAVLYDLTGTYKAGLKGDGRRIAVIGRSRIDPKDLTSYATVAGGSTIPPTVVIPPTGVDPLLAGGGDQGEATLDVELAGAIAPGAQIDLVITTSAAGGIFGAATYAVQHAQYDAINISFGSCEAQVSQSSITNWDTLFAQAAAQGTSVFVASGDTGAAGCDPHTSGPPPAVQISSASYICASSYATCVGGTEFTADVPNSSIWWSSTNTNGVSVQSYMTEGAWNDPTYINSSGVLSYVALAGGGGPSQYISKPAWQTGPGVPNDGRRDTPDVSLSSSSHDGYYGCFALDGGDCSANKFLIFSGTSVAAPSMAAISALLNERLNARQGNLNPSLYRIAANSAYHAFHDTTLASADIFGCNAGTPSVCNNSTPGPTSLTGGLAGFVVGDGYDEATGLGSPDVNYLIAAFAAPTPTTLAVSAPSVVGFGDDIPLTAKITEPYSPAPTGTITFSYQGVTLGTAFATVNSTLFYARFLPVGSYHIEATYSGDVFYGPSQALGAAGIDVTVILPPGLSIKPSVAALTLAAGATAENTNTVTLTSVNGLSGPVNLSCTFSNPNQPDPPACQFANASPALAANGTVTTSVSLVTGQRSSKVKAGAFAGNRLLRGGGLLALLLPFYFRRRTGKSSVRPIATLAVGLILWMTGCGGSSNEPIGTNPGTYTVTVVGQGFGVLGTVTAQTTFNLTVQ